METSIIICNVFDYSDTIIDIIKIGSITYYAVRGGSSPLALHISLVVPFREGLPVVKDIISGFPVGK